MKTKKLLEMSILAVFLPLMLVFSMTALSCDIELEDGNNPSSGSDKSIPSELFGEWVYEAVPLNVVIRFTSNQVIMNGTQYNAQAIGKWIEIRQSASGSWDTFCNYYVLNSGRLTFTGGIGEGLTSSMKLVKKSESGGSPTPLEGTWEEDTRDSNGKLTVSGNNYLIRIYDDLDVSGTFTLSGNQITIAIKYLSVDGGMTWLTREEYINRYTFISSEQIWSYTLSGEVLSLTDASGTRYYQRAQSWAPPASSASLTMNQWTNGSLTDSAREQWYSFYVSSGTRYYIWLNDADGDLSGAVDAQIRAYTGNGTENITVRDNAWDSPAQFTASSSGTVYVKVEPHSSGNGAFAIVYSIDSTRPGSGGGGGGGLVPSLLTMNQWREGNFTSDVREQLYSFTVTSGTTYYIWWNDRYAGDSTKTVDVEVSAYYSNQSSIFTNVDAGWTSPRTFTASSSGTVYVKVEPYFSYNNGTYAIVYSTESTRPSTSGGSTPQPWTPPSNAIPLTANLWALGYLNFSDSEEWYSFNVNSGITYRIWWNDYNGDETYTTDVQVSAWYSNGDPIFTNTDRGYSDPRYFTASSSSTVYIKAVVRPNSYDVGSYAIVYSTGTTRPY